MTIPPGEVAYTKNIGHLDNNPVVEIGLKGGLHAVFVRRGGKLDPIGAGSHPAIARHMAKKKTDGKLQLTELNKGDHVDPAHFADILPHYEANLERYAARVALAFLASRRR